MDDIPRDQLSAELADSVEAAWTRSGAAPDLIALLADHPRWSYHELRDALLVDQQFRGRTSRPWLTEDYLHVLPPQAADDDLVLDLIYGECRARNQEGVPPNLEEMVRRFPQLAQRLERQMEIASWFQHDASSQTPLVDEDSRDTSDPRATRFGDYEIFEEIARGGMGVIYRARHRKLKRIVALKMIRPERLMRTADLRRFKNETRIIAQLHHPNIIDILHVDEVDGVHFFTMRLVGGRDLEQRRTEYLNDVRCAARLVSSVAAAIHYAHQHGVLHRDLKPSNVLVDEEGVPFVVDFGLACHLPEASHLKLTDEFQGTPAYAAPELLQVESQPPNVAVDVYGLGAILYVLITGHAPFAGRNSLEVWNRIRQNDPSPPRSLNAHVDPDVEAICLRALAKNPASRYPSAAALAEDLERFLAGKPVAARPVSWWQHHVRWLRQHPVGPALAITAAIVIFGLLAIIAVQSSALHQQKEIAEAARMEAERYRQALEGAASQAERSRGDSAAEQPPHL